MSLSGRAAAALLFAAALAGCAGAASPSLRLASNGTDVPEPVHGKRLLPARIRRLTNLELERSLTALTGLDVALAAELPPDVRQEGYTPNAEQDVSATWATRYSALVREIARRAVREKLSLLAPCAGRITSHPPDPQTPGSDGDACRTSIVARLGRRAYRRPLDAGEQASLEAAFSAGDEA